VLGRLMNMIGAPPGWSTPQPGGAPIYDQALSKSPTTISAPISANDFPFSGSRTNTRTDHAFCHVRDHVWVVDCVYRCEVAGVESVVALLHEREQVCGPAGVGGRGVHDDFLSDSFFALALSESIRLKIRFSL
jgi:hypothetical protein